MGIVKKMKIKSIPKLLFSIVICQLAGIIGSFFTVHSVSTWYTGIIKPAFTPPNWVFGPVWTALFALMGISLYLVWIKGIKTKKAKIALALFGIQVFLNVLWSMLFFGLRLPFYAFIEIIILWIFILLAIIWFYNISKAASYLLIPYLIWVSFAAVLNLAIVLLNL